MISKTIALTALAAAVLGMGVAEPAGAAAFSGEFYHVASGSTNFTLSTTLNVLAGATLTGTFTPTTVNYAGGDASSIINFLGNDGISYTGPSGAYDMSDGIIVITGNLYVAAGTTTFSINHDDAAQFTVNGQVVAAGDCCGTSFGQEVFNVAGYVPFEVIYANTNFGGGSGYGNIAAFQNGILISSAVPEPTSWAMMLLGLGGIGFAMRRRQNVSVAYG